MKTDSPMRVAELCAGYGGLGLGLSHAGLDHEVVWYSELEDAFSVDLVNVHSSAPNLGNLVDIEDPPEVDLITAGFPCQPVSTAGLRKGTHDERWLIDDVCRIASASGAKWLILENVRGLLTANGGDALARVCAAMAYQGFSRWEWGTLRASAVGACHQRERWFCVASHADSEGWQGAQPEERHELPAGSYFPTPAAWDGYRGPDLGRVDRPESGGMDLVTTVERLMPTPTPSNPNAGEDPAQFDARQQARIAAGSRPSPQPLGMVVNQLPTPTAMDSVGSRRATARTDAWTSKTGTTLTDVAYGDTWGDYAPSIARHELMVGRPPPDPTVDGGKLSPLFVEWMMGLPLGHVTDHVPNRRRALHVLGNGVVPQQAAAAIGELGRTLR